MSTPISEQIAAKVKERLEAIKTSGGYKTTTAGVVRPTREDESNPKDYEIYITQGDKVPNDALSHPGNPPAVAEDFPFIIRGILRPSEKLTTPIDTLKNVFEADIKKALAVPTTGDWAQWDGLAINSKISGVTDVIEDDGSSAGFQVVLTVTYRVSENDPYVVRA